MSDTIVKQLQRIESKLDFMLRQSTRKESVPLAPEAYSALAQAGMDPRQLSTHKVVTLLDDWHAEQIEAKGIAQQDGMKREARGNAKPIKTKYICPTCKKAQVSQWGIDDYQCDGCSAQFHMADLLKEDSDEQG